MTLEIVNVSKKLGDFELRNFSLAIGEGAYYVLIGPSGVGKSVLLELVAGLIAPDSGRVYWRGEDVTEKPPETRGFALVYQDYALFPHMTVLDNAAYGLRAKGAGRKAAREGAAQAAKIAGVSHLLNRTPPSLSGGEAQRVALARAIAARSNLTLLDEPLSAVDLSMRRSLRRELRRIHRETGTTFLHVTHEVDEAMELGSEIGVMLGGELKTSGTPESVFQSPGDPETAKFLGLRNVIAASRADGGFLTFGGEFIFANSPDTAESGGVSHLWIRPEEIILSKEAFSSSARNQFECNVDDWLFEGVLVAVRISAGGLRLTAMITYASFCALDLKTGDKVFATFKSSAVNLIGSAI